MACDVGTGERLMYWVVSPLRLSAVDRSETGYGQATLGCLLSTTSGDIIPQASKQDAKRGRQRRVTTLVRRGRVNCSNASEMSRPSSWLSTPPHASRRRRRPASIWWRKRGWSPPRHQAAEASAASAPDLYAVLKGDGRNARHDGFSAVGSAAEACCASTATRR